MERELLQPGEVEMIGSLFHRKHNTGKLNNLPGFVHRAGSAVGTLSPGLLAAEATLFPEVKESNHTPVNLAIRG